jgi:hypothetical protein
MAYLHKRRSGFLTWSTLKQNGGNAIISACKALFPPITELGFWLHTENNRKMVFFRQGLFLHTEHSLRTIMSPMADASQAAATKLDIVIDPKDTWEEWQEKMAALDEKWKKEIARRVDRLKQDIRREADIYKKIAHLRRSYIPIYTF